MLFNRSDIRNPSGVSGYRLDMAVEKMKAENGLEGLGVCFQHMEEKYSINSIILLSIAILESGYGLSKLAKEKNNLFGLDANDSYKGTENYGGKYKSKEECIEAAAFRIAKQYLEIDVTCPWRYIMGKVDLDSLGDRWCSNPEWANKVNRIAENINDIVGLETERDDREEVWNEIEKTFLDLKNLSNELNEKIDSSYNNLKDFF